MLIGVGSVIFRSPRVPVLAMCLALVCSVGFVAPSAAEPTGQSCASRETPPSTISSPDEHAPDGMSTGPLPVPRSHVGGSRLNACGLVTPEQAPDVPKHTTAASWVVQDLDTGDVVAARAPHARQRPASLIKLLLALVVVDRFDAADEITPTKADAEEICSCVGLVEGEQYTVDEVLHGLLMISGNDAAHAFGTALGGQRAALRKMNHLADRLGARDTRATSTSGLDTKGMVTSAYDLGVIYSAAMREPRIAKVLDTKKFTFPGKEGDDDYPIRNDNKLLDNYSGFLGGKTGFTDNAQHTYVGGAERDGTKLGVVLLRGKQRPDPLAKQAARLLDYGFRLREHDREPVGTMNGIGNAAESQPDTSAGATTSDARHTAGTTSGSSGSLGSWPWITGTILLLLLTVVLVITRERRAGS